MDYISENMDLKLTWQYCLAIVFADAMFWQASSQARNVII